MKLSKEHSTILIENCRKIIEAFEELQKVHAFIETVPRPEELTEESFEDPNDYKLFLSLTERLVEVIGKIK